MPDERAVALIERGNLPDGGGRHLTFGEMTRRRGVQHVALLNPNSPEGIDTVRALAPDLIISVRYGIILRPPVLSVPRLGVLNLHSGLLPAYRGVLATFRALLRGDSTIGSTLHYITDRTIDTGPIVGHPITDACSHESGFLETATSLDGAGQAEQRGNRNRQGR